MTFTTEQLLEIHCPTCGGENTHVIAAGTDWGGDDDRLDAWARLECEQGGHAFQIRLHQHRGLTTVETRSRPVLPAVEAEPFDWDDDLAADVDRQANETRNAAASSEPSTARKQSDR